MAAEREGDGRVVRAGVAPHQYIRESADVAQSPAWICMQVGPQEQELA